MVDLSPTQLLIIGVIVLVLVALVVFGLRRGSLRSASLRGMGMGARIEGAPESKPLTDQTIQTDEVKAKSSWFRIMIGAKTSFRRSRFKNSVVEIVSDGTGATQEPGDGPSFPLTVRTRPTRRLGRLSRTLPGGAGQARSGRNGLAHRNSTRRTMGAGEAGARISGPA